MAIHWKSHQRTHLAIALLLCAGVSATSLSSAFRVYAADNIKAMTLYNNALDAYERHDNSQALMLLDDAIKADPSYADAYYNKATILYYQHQYASAAKAFKKAYELRPEDMQALYNAGLSFEKDGQNGRAVDAFQKIRPDSAKYQEAQKKIAQLKSAQHGFFSHKTEPAKETPLTEGQKTEENLSKNPAQEKALKDKNTATLQKPYYEPYGTAGHAMKTGKLPVQTLARDFEGPTGMAIGPNGFLYVADYNKNLIYKLMPDGRKMVFAQGEAIKGPIGMVFDPHSNMLFVANYQNNTIARINPQGESSVVASNMHKPYCLYLDQSHNTLYVSEQENNSVSIIPLGVK